MTDDLEFHYPDESPANPGAAAPKKCRHVWMGATRDRVTGQVMWVGHLAPLPDDEPVVACRHCDAIRDEAAARRGRLNSSRGKRIQRKRIEGLGGTNLAGNNENLDGIGLAFCYESKSGKAGSVFSEQVWRWLTGIPTKGDQTGVLIITETPGPGRKARSYVVVEYDQWRDLHGESKGDEA